MSNREYVNKTDVSYISDRPVKLSQKGKGVFSETHCKLSAMMKFIQSESNSPFLCGSMDDGVMVQSSNGRQFFVIGKIFSPSFLESMMNSSDI